MTGRRHLLALVVVMATAAIAPQTASAAPPPKGRYDCKFMDGRTYGALKILSTSRYSWHNGRRGRYSTQARKIRFRSGPLKGVYRRAEWRRNGGTVWINLFDGAEYGRTATDAQCIKRRSG